MQLESIFEIESSYENTIGSRSIESFAEDQRKYISWLKLLEVRNFDAFYFQTDELIKNAESLNETCFLLSWAIVGTEVQYQIAKRKFYIDQLEALGRTEFNLYVEYCRNYFSSLSYYYDAHLLLSEVLNNKALAIAENLKYPRGTARCLYQKTLIFQEMKRDLEFKQSLNNCLQICSAHLLLKTKEKAFVLLVPAANQGVNTVENYIQKIEAALDEKDLKYARSLIVEAEIRRKKQKIHRGRYSLSIYRTMCLILSGKLSYARRFINTFQDQVQRLQIYTFMQTHQIQMTLAELENLKSIQFFLNISETTNSACDLILNQIHISKIKNENVRLLISAMTQSESISKEALFEKVFGISYDPVIHDSKVYKLILRAKKEISHDIVFNSYGKYSLNLTKYKFIA